MTDQRAPDKSFILINIFLFLYKKGMFLGILNPLKHQAKFVADDIQIFFFFFQRKRVLKFYVNRLPSRRFT